VRAGSRVQRLDVWPRTGGRAAPLAAAAFDEEAFVTSVLQPIRFHAARMIKRLRELQRQDLTRDELLLKLGAAKKEAGKAYGLLAIHIAR